MGHMTLKYLSTGVLQIRYASGSFCPPWKNTEAIDTLDVLSKIYIVQELSSEVCKAFGRYRRAQIFSLAAM
jgi:hypothetical protein